MLTTKAAYSSFNASLGKHTGMMHRCRRYKDTKILVHIHMQIRIRIRGGNIWRLAEAWKALRWRQKAALFVLLLLSFWCYNICLGDPPTIRLA